MFGRSVRRSVQFWRDRNEIIGDLQRGLYNVTQTMWRLEEHAKIGGTERIHMFSCRNGWDVCRCPFKFDRRGLVPLSMTQEKLP